MGVSGVSANGCGRLAKLVLKWIQNMKQYHLQVQMGQDQEQVQELWESLVSLPMGVEDLLNWF